MKRILKWTVIVALVLFAAFISLVGYGVASGNIEARSIYFEWQHKRLTQRLAGKTDADSLHNSNVLAACDKFFGVQRPDDAYYCYKGVFNDQRKPWVLLHKFDETKRYGLSAYPNGVRIWSSNMIYANTRIYAADFAVFCAVDHMLVTWSLMSENYPIIQSIRYQLGENDIGAVTKNDEEIPRDILMERNPSRQFISEAEKIGGILKTWISDETGKEHEFRFDISKLPKQLSILRETCGR